MLKAKAPIVIITKNFDDLSIPNFKGNSEFAQ